MTTATVCFTRPDARTLVNNYRASYRDPETGRMLAYVDLGASGQSVRVSTGPDWTTTPPVTLKAGAALVRMNLMSRGYDHLERI